MASPEQGSPEEQESPVDDRSVDIREMLDRIHDAIDDVLELDKDNRDELVGIRCKAPFQ